MLYPHTPIVYPSEYRSDSDGNAVRWPSLEGVPVPANIQPHASAVTTVEAGKGGPSQQTRVEAVAYLSGTFCPALDAYAALDWDGWRWVMVGDPIDHQSPDGTLRMWRAEIRRDRALADAPRHG
ncbi:hypothetical protein [Stackebrandtia nassauensis]|uniref:Uncharacterized protein n=1 Tax=Stackebrandtia nassauensis (strain DSM 44728 / CIP 108903 / NRRL B-16338 / NBRC 102104 / LLR-40K-21) TaxID=446470 RepID=D3Q2E5_STANL|nr:hypothetical protein [Stackebrandtia nassauensis]ADD43878.1 hypothetical protein Snas_4229 [Stackebrandtia nassauensis DSM 44728]